MVIVLPLGVRPSSTLRYTPALDGLRAVAVLLVFVFHVPGTAWYLPTGSLGVDVFFVLSGFLITRLLVDEQAASGAIGLGNFYARRALRLVPALAVTVVGVLVISMTEAAETRQDILLDVAAVSTYTSNWFYAFEALPRLYLQHSWSLAIEEQYYILWALAVVGLLRAGVRAEKLASLALGLAAASAAWRLILLVVFDASYDRVYFATDTRLDGLLLGSALGAAMASPLSNRLRRLASHPRAPVVAAGLVAGLVGLARVEGVGNVAVFGALLPLVALASAALTLVLAEGNAGRLGRVFANPGAVRVGRLSYGIYLFHVPVIIVLRRAFDPSPELLFVMAVVVTGVLAEISWRVIESRALALKSRFRTPEIRTTATEVA